MTNPIFFAALIFFQIKIDYHILPCLYLLLKLHTDRIIIKEVCWIISNITVGTTSQIQVKKGFDLLDIFLINRYRTFIYVKLAKVYVT